MKRKKGGKRQKNMEIEREGDRISEELYLS